MQKLETIDWIFILVKNMGYPSDKLVSIKYDTL